MKFAAPILTLVTLTVLSLNALAIPAHVSDKPADKIYDCVLSNQRADGAVLQGATASYSAHSLRQALSYALQNYPPIDQAADPKTTNVGLDATCKVRQ